MSWQTYICKNDLENIGIQNYDDCNKKYTPAKAKINFKNMWTKKDL